MPVWGGEYGGGFGVFGSGSGPAPASEQYHLLLALFWESQIVEVEQHLLLVLAWSA